MGPLCVIGRGYILTCMKEHPRLFFAALVGALAMVAIAYIYTSTPRPEVIAPVVEAPTQEAEIPAEEGAIFSGERGLGVRVNGRTATITGPAPVLEKIESCTVSVGWYGPGGNGLYVEWGDGRTSPTFVADREGESCRYESSTHTYERPGAYTVIVTLWHPGPADEPITDWEDSVVVIVD